MVCTWPLGSRYETLFTSGAVTPAARGIACPQRKLPDKETAGGMTTYHRPLPGVVRALSPDCTSASSWPRPYSAILPYTVGVIFWLWRNRFVGSYLRFRSARRW